MTALVLDGKTLAKQLEGELGSRGEKIRSTDVQHIPLFQGESGQ